MKKFKVNIYAETDDIEETKSFDTELERKAFISGFYTCANLYSSDGAVAVEEEMDENIKK